jgi:hypothetical protein
MKDSRGRFIAGADEALYTEPPEPEPVVEQQQQPRSRKSMWAARVVLALVVYFIIVELLAALAPHDYSKLVSPTTISSSACGTFGPIIWAREINNAGPYKLYMVRCADGIQVEAGGN